MVNEPQRSDPMDPLHDVSGLLLFPRTITCSTNAPNPNHPGDLESIHDFMKSMALRNPNKHSDQAKAIVDGNSELLKSEFASFMAIENENKAVDAKGKEKIQERRPGLGRKRPQFSLKPNSSHPSVSLEPTLDIDRLQDPEEFFLAYEKLENAKKELRRQRGEIMSGLNDNNQFNTKRHRRPGILGKSFSYKHNYSSKLPEIDDTFMPSQETLGQDILSPPNYISQQKTADSNVELKEKKLTGSIAKNNNNADELLDELLSQSFENLAGDGALSFLQERLQIKPLNLDKLCLPDFHDVGKIDFLGLGEKLPKPRSALSDIQNLVKGKSGKSPVKHKQVAESPAHSQASPTPPKNPFASISVLTKRIFQSNLSNNLFSALDLSPSRNSSSVDQIDKQSNQFDTRKELRASGKLKSLIAETGDVRVDDMGSREVIRGDSVLPFEKPMNDDSNRFGVGINAGSSESHSDCKDDNGSRNIDNNDNKPNTDTDLQADGANEMEGNVGDMPLEALSSGQLDVNFEDSFIPYPCFQIDGPNETEENVEDMPQNAEPDINIEEPTVGKLESNQSQPDQSSPVTVGSHAVDGPSKTSDVISEQHIEEALDVNFEDSSRPYSCLQTDGPNEMENVEDMPQNAVPNINTKEPTVGKLGSKKSQPDPSSPAAVGSHALDGPSKTPDVISEQHIENIQVPSRVSLNERSKAKRPPCSGTKRKARSHRQSLAGAGTFWESGVRRSKRIKMRPLEYWKGERFLYGRIHESLTTVIGVKYVSPGKGNEKPHIRVKSYVSDEYKELVELAALH